MKRPWKLLYIWLVFPVGGLIPAALCFYAGKAIDCMPGQIDGQCGLSTFMGMLGGALAWLTVVCIGPYPLRDDIGYLYL